jgi:deoxyribonuclease-4
VIAKDIMITQNRSIGLHVRLTREIFEVVNAVQTLHLPIVQSFLLTESGSYAPLSVDIARKFASEKKKIGFSYFVHAAYWSNLIKKDSKEFISLCQEAEFAKELGSDGIVIHIGAFATRLEKLDQMRFVAECIHELLHKVSGLPIVLENGPHAGRNFGSDLEDFGILFSHLDDQNQVKFCLDTAHAFVYGYELTNPEHLKSFFALVEQVIGKQRLGLLHLNDAAERCDSNIDKHEIAGQGHIGQTVLEKIMHHPLFSDTPIILELPGSCTPEDEKHTLKTVQSWDKPHR